MEQNIGVQMSTGHHIQVFIFPPFQYITMRDLDHSLGLNLSRFGSIGWQNFNFDEASHSASMLPRYNHNTVNTHSVRLQSLLNQPPRPPASIYNCLQSDQEQQGDIKEVDYMQNQPEAKHVNSKQYFRMMKRRIKKVMEEYRRNQLAGKAQVPPNQEEPLKGKKNGSKEKPKYIYESRHLHAARRLRGKDGKFLPTRPQHQRFKEKKKRGRKPKNKAIEINNSTSSVPA